MAFITHRRPAKIWGRPATYLVLGILSLLGALAVHPWDMAIKNALQSSSLIPYIEKDTPWGDLLRVVRSFGRADTLVALALVFAARGFKRRSLEALLALLLICCAVWTLKPTVDRERPNGKKHSFPSGDAASAAAFSVPLMAASRTLVVPGLVICVGVPLLRMADNYHFASDVCAGLGIGLLAAAAVMQLNPTRRRWPAALRKGQVLLVRLKPRYLALGALLLGTIFFLPALFKGKGGFLDAAQCLGPVTLFWLATGYVGFLHKQRSAKRGQRPAFVAMLKEFFFALAENSVARRRSALYRHACVALTVASLALAAAMALPVWFADVPKLRLVGTGAGLLILAINIDVFLARRRGLFIRATSNFFVGMVVLVVSLWCVMLPALQRQQAAERMAKFSNEVSK